MTLRELSTYRELRREIESMQQQLAELRQRILHPSNSATSFGRNTGNRHADRMAEYVSRYEQIMEALEALDLEALDELYRLEILIGSIPTSQDRVILDAFLVRGLNWKQIAREYDGTEDSVRMRAQRVIGGLEKDRGGGAVVGRQDGESMRRSRG